MALFFRKNFCARSAALPTHFLRSPILTVAVVFFLNLARCDLRDGNSITNHIRRSLLSLVTLSHLTRPPHNPRNDTLNM